MGSLEALEARINDLINARSEDREVSSAILAQVRETNGRVRALELWKARIDGARMTLQWVPSAAVGIVVAVVGTIATRALF